MYTFKPTFGTRPRYRQQFSKPRHKPNPIMMEGLEPAHRQAIEVPDIQEFTEDVAIDDVKQIGSYNWIKAPLDQPTIIVPGSPALWKERPFPFDVQPDTGSWPVDEHTLRLSNTPFLPLITAVNLIQKAQDNEPFDWSSVDFITSRNVLRNLTRWAHGKSRDDFRIDLDLVGEKTVLLNRWSGPSSEGEFFGNTFGINFERESTTIGERYENATGNIRVVSYDLNGLKMVVRFEANACLPGKRSTAEDITEATISSLTSQLERVNVGESRITIDGNEGPLTIIQGGSFSQEELIEITTRSVTNLARNSFDWREAYPQLFLSQTKHHYLAIHERGHFIKLEKRTLESEEFQKVEKEVQDDLKRLYQVLLTIQETVRDKGKVTRLSLVFVKDQDLRIFARTRLEKACLPESASRFFDRDVESL